MEGVSLLSARRIILQHSRIEIGTRLYTHMPITPGVWGRNEKRKRGSIQKNRKSNRIPPRIWEYAIGSDST